MNLLPKRSASAPGTSTRRARAPIRTAAQREHRDHEPNKPYAAVRRAPKPLKQPAPKQFMVRERDADLRAAYGHTGMKLKRWFREGELLWCALSTPIVGNAGSVQIDFWPGIVEEIKLKTQTIPRGHDENGQNMGINGRPSSPEGPPQGWRASEHPSSGLGPTVETLPLTPWTVRQSTMYKMKLLGISHSYTVPDDQVLPYQAYAPSSELLDAVQAVPFKEMDIDPERMATFNPCPVPPTDPGDLDNFVPNDSGRRFAAAVGPYSMGVQIAASLAGCWTVTDEWDFKHTVVPTIGPSIVRPQIPRSTLSLHDVLLASANYNAGLRTMADSGLMPSVAGPSTMSYAPMPQTVTQRRFQGLWWGAERIWTDDLVRLKVARRQIAPKGAENIFPPSGPSQKTIEFGQEVGFSHPEGEEFDASGRGVFMRLEALFITDVPRENDSGTKEQIRASGMLYELADVDWEDPEEQSHKPVTKVPETIEEGQVGLSSSMPSMPVSNPPAGVPVASTSTSVPGPLTTDQDLSPNNLLSHPPNSLRYPMPVAPTGFKFRPILPPGYEAVVSLTLVSGRYYPCLLAHPLLETIVERALADALPDSGPSDSEHLWALEGLSPGYYNSVDPELYKKDRLQMMKYADKEARAGLDQHWHLRALETAQKMDREHEQDQFMDVDP